MIDPNPRPRTGFKEVADRLNRNSEPLTSSPDALEFQDNTTGLQRLRRLP